MKKLAAFLALLLCAALASAAPNQSIPAADGEPRALAEQMMRFLATEDLDGLFAMMNKLMPLPRNEFESMRDKTVDQRKQLLKVYGAFLGNTFISECRRSDVLHRVIFIEKRVKMFIRWEFTFYRPRDKWQMSSFLWDTKNDHLFEACN